MRRFATLLASLLAVIWASGSAGASDYVQFRSPTGNIGCGYADGTLRCDVRDGIKPLPPMPSSCEFDWGQGYWLHRTGRASVVCAGDTTLNHSTVIAYGTTWEKGGLACASSTNGFRCTNVHGHGFFISRGEAYRF